jgi:hypothetical protein
MTALTRQDGSPVDAEPILKPCARCDERCDAYPCSNANPKGRDEIEAAEAAK